MKTKEYLVNALINKDQTTKAKEDTMDSQLKDLLARIDVLKGEKASDAVRIEQVVKENQDLTTKLAKCLEAKLLTESKFHVSMLEILHVHPNRIFILSLPGDVSNEFRGQCGAGS